MGGFELAKHYLDCVTDRGEVVIAYRAELRWRALTVHYASLLLCDEAGVVSTRSTLRKTAAPVSEAGVVAWVAPALEFEGTWRGGERSPIERTIHSSEQGDVVWRLDHPRADVSIQLGGRTLVGRGYVEHLTLTTPPWAMPIDELRWGRFIGPTRSLVWIDWRGPTCTQVIVDGDRVLEIRLEVADDRVGALAISEPRVLRAGAIGATALSILPKPVRDAFPGRILFLDEKKWRARGELDGERGWIIHEVVRWP